VPKTKGNFGKKGKRPARGKRKPEGEKRGDCQKKATKSIFKGIRAKKGRMWRRERERGTGRRKEWSFSSSTGGFPYTRSTVGREEPKTRFNLGGHTPGSCKGSLFWGKRIGEERTLRRREE